MATSPLFGWEEPDDTDLVKDGAAAMRTLGNAIDTSMGDLLGGTTGQILSKASNTNMDFTWITNDQGDITAVVAGSGISVTSGTGPIPSVALDLTSANVFTAAQTATRFIVTGSTVATNGMYLSAANTVAFSTNSNLVMAVNSAGEFTVGATAGRTGNSLSVTKTITGSTSGWGINVSGTIQSGVTGNARMFISTPSTVAAAFTLSELTHFYANGATAGATSSITTQYGFFADSAMTSAATNIGFYGQIASGTNRWNAYMAGTASNYFAGRTGVGVLLTSSAQFGITNVQSATDATMLTRNFAAQTELSLSMQNSAASVIFGVTAAGLMKYISGNTATTVGAAGGASALPATPTGYLKIDIGGTEYKVPYYAA